MIAVYELLVTKLFVMKDQEIADFSFCKVK